MIIDIGHVDAIFRYPVKSMAGERVDGADVGWHGIEGVLTWTVDGKSFDIGPGQALCIPRGAVHRFDNDGTEDAKVLCAISPAAIGPQFFRESAEVKQSDRNSAASNSSRPPASSRQ